jgi:hypothetical protein
MYTLLSIKVDFFFENMDKDWNKTSLNLCKVNSNNTNFLQLKTFKIPQCAQFIYT